MYDYDNSGNLTRKYLFSNFGATVSAGHIMACYPYCLESEITYGYSTSQWGDLLTSYNGTAISYDSIGNPTNWRGASSLTWQGRKLTRHTSTAGDFTDFTYNADGIRTSKSRFDTVTSERTTHSYILDGSKIIKETVTGAQSYTNYYLYDASGSIAGLEYNGTVYYFQKNTQGDIIRICDTSGNTVVQYTYDSWGKVLSTTGTLASTIGARNPFRYRGYYYDVETGFYATGTRYYDPEIGRWISPEPNVDFGEFDEGAGLIGYNVYAYCANNPINNFDPTGEFVISTAVLIGIGIGALIGGIAGGAYGYNKAVKNNVPKGQRWKCVVGYGLGGAVVGGIIGGFVGYGVGVALGAKASSGVVIKSVSKAISSISRNSINHIMQSKHAWGSVLRRATWSNVKGLINTTIQKGATTLINKQGSALVYEAIRNNVVVRYAVIDGIIKISDAWVKTR